MLDDPEFEDKIDRKLGSAVGPAAVPPTVAMMRLGLVAFFTPFFITAAVFRQK